MIKNIEKLVEILEQNITKIQDKIEKTDPLTYDRNNLHHLLLRYTKLLTYMYNRMDEIKKNQKQQKPKSAL